MKQQGKCTVSYRVLGQVIVDNENVLALMHEILANRAACIRRDILQRRGLGGGRRNDAGVVHCTVLCERFRYLRYGRALLADRNINTDNARALLIDDGVQADGGLAGLTVTDDQLALAAADRDHGVDRLDTGLERHVYRCALDDARGGTLDRTGLCCIDGALAVDRLAQRVNDAAQHCLTDRDLHDALRALYRVALTDILVGTQDNGADEILFKVLRHAVYAARKFEQLTRHAVLQTMDMRDTVAYGDDRTDVGQLDLALVVRDLLLDNITDLFRA